MIGQIKGVSFMDIVLERILSLLPKKPDGKFVRGGKKEFAQSIGYDSGDIVSMWINGSSTSYNGKLHEISAKYGVSVEWLRGETDEKNPAPRGDGTKEIESIFDQLTPSRQAKLLELARLYLDDQRRNEEIQ